MADSFIPTPEMVDAVAEWQRRDLRDQVKQSLVPLLKARFELDNLQAIAVIREATLRHGRAA